MLYFYREFWPDESTFGTNSTTPEDEFMIMRNLLFQELESTCFHYVYMFLKPTAFAK